MFSLVFLYTKLLSDYIYIAYINFTISKVTSKDIGTILLISKGHFNVFIKKNSTVYFKFSLLLSWRPKYFKYFLFPTNHKWCQSANIKQIIIMRMNSNIIILPNYHSRFENFALALKVFFISLVSCPV